MIYPQQIRAVDPIQLAAASGTTKFRRFSAPTPPVVRPFLLTQQFRGCSCAECGGMAKLGLPPDYGRLRGLGQTTYVGDPGTFTMSALQVPSAGTGAISPLQTIAVGANFIPGVGQIASIAITTFTQFLNKFEAWFHLGAGRREADIIVPVQNQLMQALGVITNEFLVSQTPTVDQIDDYYRQVWIHGVAFQEFVLMRNFTDRRASGQALNTVMPYLDGSCGYPVPVGFTATPGQQNCLSWGDGTIGGVGTNGMLGALARANLNYGGTLPSLPDMHVAANQGIRPTAVAGVGPGGLPLTIMGVSTPLAFVIGIGALLMYKKGRLF